MQLLLPYDNAKSYRLASVTRSWLKMMKEEAIQKISKQFDVKIDELNARIKLAKSDQSKLPESNRIANVERVIENCEMMKKEFETYKSLVSEVMKVRKQSEKEALQFISTRRAVLQSQVDLLNKIEGKA